MGSELSPPCGLSLATCIFCSIARVSERLKIDKTAMAAAGDREARRYALMIRALRHDRSKTPEQKGAIIRRLGQEQADAVANARKDARCANRRRLWSASALSERVNRMPETNDTPLGGIARGRIPRHREVFPIPGSLPLTLATMSWPGCPGLQTIREDPKAKSESA
jgi:hypothetical protein